MLSRKRDGIGPAKRARRKAGENGGSPAKQKASEALSRVRFSSGARIGPLELSPQLTARQRRVLEFWIRRLPETFRRRLPRLKVAAARHLRLSGGRLVINGGSLAGKTRLPSHTHAASFIPQRYVIFQGELFRRRVEAGRIAYHELCHFLWPRLGNPKRRRFDRLLRQEFRERVRGELGYSAAWRKANLLQGGAALRKVSSRKWREYACESFCDTGSFVLLGGERRRNHSEYTLSGAARVRRVRLWRQLILEGESGVAAKRGRRAPGGK